MLRIYAVDPEVCEKLDWIKYIAEQCTIQNGRAIADLPPREWCSRGLDCINGFLKDDRVKPIQASRIKSCLNRIRGRLVDRPGTQWDYGSTGWCSAAEKEHKRWPFGAVISPSISSEDPREDHFHPGDLDEDVQAWGATSGVIIGRRPLDLANAIIPDLLLADNIQIIDPYFDFKDRYQDNFREIFSQLSTQRAMEFPSEIVVHCCPQESMRMSAKYAYDELKETYQGSILLGKCVRFQYWQPNDGCYDAGAHPMHNRYILTDKFGILVGYGLDSAHKKTDATDDLLFMDDKARKVRYNQYRRLEVPGAEPDFWVEVIGTLEV